MTPHIGANKEDIAKTVIMSGDPLRIKMIAETYLTDYKQVNEIRGMLAYTGYYEGKRLTVMAHGMGIPSVGIYSYELYNFYDVDNIIRLGSCGSYDENIMDLYDVLLVEDTYSESTYAINNSGFKGNIIEGNKKLFNLVDEVAKRSSIKIKKGRVHCSDAFYYMPGKHNGVAIDKGCLGVEMETFGLFNNANVLGKRAVCLLTVSDITKVVDGTVTFPKVTDSSERQNAFNKMIELALEVFLEV